MKILIIFFLAAPMLVFALSKEEYASLQNQAANSWQQHEKILRQAITSPLEEEKKTLLTQALVFCQKGLWLAETVLVELTSEAKTVRKKKWYLDVQKQAVEEKERFQKQVTFLKDQISVFEANESIVSLSHRAEQVIAQAQTIAQEFSKHLYNVDEVVASQQRAALLYEEAASLLAQIENSTALPIEKESVRQKKELCISESISCKLQADHWPEVVAKNIERYKQQIDFCVQECKRLRSLGAAAESQQKWEQCQELIALLQEHASIEEAQNLIDWQDCLEREVWLEDNTEKAEAEYVSLLYTEDQLSSLEQQSYAELDLFVEQNNKDPLALASFVQNEVLLKDPFVYEKEGIFFPQGIFKSPLRTYQDRQGTAWELCQLLVYLLRKAGCDAAYAVEGRCMTSVQTLQNSLGVSLALKDAQAIVAYPWVVCTDGVKTLSLFPWLKQTSPYTGEALAVLGDRYESIRQWLEAYQKGEQGIHRLRQDDGDNSAASLFLRSLQEQKQPQDATAKSDLKNHRVCASLEQLPQLEVISQPKLYLSAESAGALATLEITLSSDKNRKKCIKEKMPLYKLPSNILFESSYRRGALEANVAGRGVNAADFGIKDAPFTLGACLEYRLGEETYTVEKKFVLDAAKPAVLFYSCGQKNFGYAEDADGSGRDASRVNLIENCARFFESYNQKTHALSTMFAVNAEPFFSMALATAGKEAPQGATLDLALFYPSPSKAFSLDSNETIQALRSMMLMDERNANLDPSMTGISYRDLALPSAVICTVFLSKYVISSLSPSLPRPSGPFHPMPKPFQNR